MSDADQQLFNLFLHKEWFKSHYYSVKRKWNFFSFCSRINSFYFPKMLCTLLFSQHVCWLRFFCLCFHYDCFFFSYFNFFASVYFFFLKLVKDKIIALNVFFLYMQFIFILTLDNYSNFALLLFFLQFVIFSLWSLVPIGTCLCIY